MAERNTTDLPASMGRSGTCLLSSEPRSFKMDRRSPEAAALRDAVSSKLLEFLGSYTDEVLTEYIIVLVCNGKHQNQARDDLEAFLGSESEKFVAWLWDHLSIQFSVSKPPLDSLNAKNKVEDGFCGQANSKKKSSYANNDKDLERHKYGSTSEIPLVEMHVDISSEHACEDYGRVL